MRVRPHALTVARICGLVEALVTASHTPVFLATVVTAARAAPWGRPYRAQHVLGALKACHDHGLLIRVQRPTVLRSRGHRRIAWAWWPRAYGDPDTADGMRPTAGAILEDQIERCLQPLPLETVFRATWIVRRLHATTGVTEADGESILQRRDAGALPRLAACPATSEWRGWWRVVAVDPDTRVWGARAASDALWQRIRTQQQATGRTSVAIRALTRGLLTRERTTLQARIAIACQPPSTDAAIMLTPRLVRIGAVHYGQHVAPLGDADRAHAELDLDAWRYAATMLERRVALEVRDRSTVISAALRHAQRAPCREVVRAMRDGLRILVAPKTGTTPVWLAAHAQWVASRPWGIDADRLDDTERTPATEWISIPMLREVMRGVVTAKQLPSIRLLRFLLQSGGVWMRPVRLLRDSATLVGGIESDRGVSAAVGVEVVDAYLWLQARYGPTDLRSHVRWTRRWIGYCRDWSIPIHIARNTSGALSAHARLALELRTMAGDALDVHDVRIRRGK